jgi:predicted esterase
MFLAKIVRKTTESAVCALLILSADVGAQSEPDEVRQLIVEMQRVLDAGDTARAVEIGRKLVDLQPDASGPAYNLACAYARAGNNEKSVAWLQTSAERGFSYIATMLRDKDLDTIRDYAGFAAAVELIKKNNAGALELFKTEAERAKIVTTLPPHFDKTKRVPLIVALHGYGSDAQDIASAWRGPAASAGAILIAPQALQKAGGGFSWGVVEQGEFLVMRAIEKTQAEYNVDPKRIILTGFSQGGGMCFTIGVRHPEMLAGVISIAGYYDHRVDPFPAQASVKLPKFVIMNGANDESADNNRDAAKRLEAISVPVLFRIYENVGHAFPPNREQELERALQFILNP